MTDDMTAALRYVTIVSCDSHQFTVPSESLNTCLALQSILQEDSFWMESTTKSIRLREKCFTNVIVERILSFVLSTTTTLSPDAAAPPPPSEDDVLFTVDPLLCLAAGDFLQCTPFVEYCCNHLMTRYLRQVYYTNTRSHSHTPHSNSSHSPHGGNVVGLQQTFHSVLPSHLHVLILSSAGVDICFALHIEDTRRPKRAALTPEQWKDVWRSHYQRSIDMLSGSTEYGSVESGMLSLLPTALQGFYVDCERIERGELCCSFNEIYMELLLLLRYVLFPRQFVVPAVETAEETTEETAVETAVTEETEEMKGNKQRNSANSSALPPPPPLPSIISRSVVRRNNLTRCGGGFALPPPPPGFEEAKRRVRQRKKIQKKKNTSSSSSSRKRTGKRKSSAAAACGRGRSSSSSGCSPSSQPQSIHDVHFQTINIFGFSSICIDLFQHQVLNTRTTDVVGSLLKVSFRGMSFLTDSFVACLVGCCPQLMSLDLSLGGTRPKELEMILEEKRRMELAAEHCVCSQEGQGEEDKEEEEKTKLTNFSLITLSKLKNLQTLEICGWTHVDGHGLAKFCSQLVRSRQLPPRSVHNSTTCSTSQHAMKLPSLSPMRDMRANVKIICPELLRFNLSGCRNIDDDGK